MNYGVAYGRGVAFGIGLQAIEASVGVGVGLIFLAREGVSYATLKRVEESGSAHDRGVVGGRGAANVLALASPASLKGVLTPLEAAAAWRGDAPGRRCRVDEAPVADGGEGTAAVLEAALGGEWRRRSCRGRSARPSTARWLVLPDGTAVVESSQAVGLPLLSRFERDPLRATSHGVGDLLLAAVAEGAASLLVGVGGTATVDGGAGMRERVGRRLDGVSIRVACDVRNPLLGPRGAARVFGPQKGAGPDAVVELERRLAAMTELAPYASCPAPAPVAGSAQRSPHSAAELVPGASSSST